MDAITRFNDTVSALCKELEVLWQKCGKLQETIGKGKTNLERGEGAESADRLAKIEIARRLSEEFLTFVGVISSSKALHSFAALEILHALLQEKDDETWSVLESGDHLSASRTVDQVTDVITELVSENNANRIAFVDNPDKFVEDFVKKYLDHGIT
ncbi:MAG: hypothetical protein IK079_01245, partial [Desulfovibrio sp.]|nr:hypothetical protein [Desulfovibrio sp.]